AASFRHHQHSRRELSPEGETESRRAQSFSPAGPDAGGQLRLGIFQTGVFGELCSDGFGAFRSGLDRALRSAEHSEKWGIQDISVRSAPSGNAGFKLALPGCADKILDQKGGCPCTLVKNA